MTLAPTMTYPLRGIAMIVIIVHHVCLSCQALGEALPAWLTRSGALYAWGYCATALFFFLSGYGMFCSLTHNTLNAAYVKRKCRRLFEPYIVLWILSLVAFAIVYRPALSWQWLWHFFLLDLPPDVNGWFFKMIIACYILSLATFRVLSPRHAVITVLAAAIGWYALARGVLHMKPWWYITVINFPLGMLFALIRPKMPALCVTIAALAGLICLKPHPAVIAVLACLAAVTLAHTLHLRGAPLAFIGQQSLYFYLLEVPVMYLLDIFCPLPLWLYVLVCLTIITALTIASTYILKFLRA